MTEIKKHWTFTDENYINDKDFFSCKLEPHFYYSFTVHNIPDNVLCGMKNIHKFRKKSCKMENITKETSKEYVIKRIREIAVSNRELLNHKKLIKSKDKSIYYASIKNFGTWNKAIIASGVAPLYENWSKDRVIKEIKKKHKETGKVPNYGELRRKKEYKLLNAANQYWDRWPNAIRAAGLKPYRNEFWTKDWLIKELKQIVKDIGHVPPKRELIKLKRNDLVSSGSKFFGSYNKFLIAAGFKPVLVPNIWTKENIKNELISIANELGRTPTERDLIDFEKRTLIPATWKQYKGWNNAIRTAGLDTNEKFVKNRTWKVWESLVLDICYEIYPDGEKHKILPNGTIPDFYDHRNRLIIEIKTNSHDNAIRKDIKSYEKYCDKIEIWYLNGKPVGVMSNKVYFIGPNQIKNRFLVKDDLRKRFGDLISKRD